MNPENKPDHYGPCSDAVERALNKPDALVRNCGSTWAFNPLSQAAKTSIDENVASEPWQWLGTSLVVDARYALGLIKILADEGFRLS